HAPDLLRGDEPGLLQDTDVLLHAREGHVELLGEVGNRGLCTSELLQNAASGGVRERGERGIEAGFRILNHMVQYITPGLTACKGMASARCVAGHLPQIDITSMQIRSTRRGTDVRPSTADQNKTVTARPWIVSSWPTAVQNDVRSNVCCWGVKRTRCAHSEFFGF